ncbi:MAG: hypothetical protein EXR71_05710 [Myxococcales bacterium]|nr:hypothetical protein [Myxococcales bacterium]
MIALWFGCATDDTGFPQPVMPGDDTVDTSPAGPLAIAATGPVVAVDECAEVCFSVVVTRDGQGVDDALVDVWIGDRAFGADVPTGRDGTASICGVGLDVGVHEALVTATLDLESATTRTAATVAAFGWADGFERDVTPVDTLPWTPRFVRYAGNPVLPPGEAGTWDEVGDIVPSVARTDDGWVMWFAGTAAVDYIVGVATSLDGINWTKDPRNPLYSGDGIEGSWRRYSTNSPMILEHDGSWFMYYTGRSEETGNLNIGLAVGEDPSSVIDVPENPVFSWTEEESTWAGQAVAHPSVLVREDGWWEMWYSTGYHRIGYAYSPDGYTWSRYCKNPVFEGDQDRLDWETNQVKANEVLRHDGWYYMTYTAGDTGAFTVGWAMSRDGIHWVRAGEPVFTAATEAGTWESSSVLSAPIVVVGDELWMWYSGTGATGSAVGLAIAPLAGAP